MNNSLFDLLPDILLRTSLAIAVTAVVIWLLLKLLRLKSPTIHRVSFVSLIYALRRATKPELAWTTQWISILRRAKIRQPIPMRVHESLGPLICLTPTGYQIVVPQELWEESSRRQREAVLNHELAHYLRGDVWKSFVVRLLALPHWFNPLAWLAVQKFDDSGEWACDRYLIENDPQGGTEFANPKRVL